MPKMPCPPPCPVHTALVGTVGLCVEMEMGSKTEPHSQGLHCSLSHVLSVLGSWVPPLGSHREPWHPWQVLCRLWETAQPHRQEPRGLGFIPGSEHTESELWFKKIHRPSWILHPRYHGNPGPAQLAPGPVPECWKKPRSWSAIAQLINCLLFSLV